MSTEHGPPPHVPGPIGELAEDLAEEVKVESTLLATAIGGWRGVIDSSLPSAVFLIVYLVNGHLLTPAVWSAVAVGAGIAIWRLLRRQSVQQVLAGFFGIAISAFVAAKTGKAENFFLPGLLIQSAYGLAFLISILVRWPLIGVLVGLLTAERQEKAARGEPVPGGADLGLADADSSSADRGPTVRGFSLRDTMNWRKDAAARRSYTAATWIWVLIFGSRVVIQVPMYLAGWVGALGVAKIVLGWPLFLLGVWLTYRVVRLAAPAVAGGVQLPSKSSSADS